MNGAVVVACLLLAAINALPALLGGWLWLSGRPPGRTLWVLVRTGQGAAVALAVGIGVLALAGTESSYHLFYLYALLPLAVSFLAEQLRALSAQTVLDQKGLPDAQAVGGLPESEQHAVVAAILAREMAVMSLSAFVVALLALRAASTAHGF